MRKIVIQSTSRTASKLYRYILNKVEGVVILHEIVFDFRFKNDIDKVLRKHNAYTNSDSIRSAIDELFSINYRLGEEFPNKETLIRPLENQEGLDWAKALTIFIEQKAINEKESISGAKNPVHSSYTERLLDELDDVKVLYLLRDPRAMYASEIYQKLKRHPLSGFPQSRIRCLQRPLIFIHSSIEWIWAMRAYRRVQGRVVLCKYEDLVTNPKNLMQRIFKFCGLEYSDDYLDDLSVIGSSHQVDSKGISKHGLDKWKSDLNVFERFWFTVLKKLFRYDQLQISSP